MHPDPGSSRWTSFRACLLPSGLSRASLHAATRLAHSRAEVVDNDSLRGGVTLFPIGQFHDPVEGRSPTRREAEFCGRQTEAP